MNHATFSSRQIGDFQITALSDGDMAASLELLSGIETAQAEAIQRDVGLTEPGNIHIYCYLIRGRGRTILVDTGMGGLHNLGGELAANLRAVGVEPEEVDTVLLTHAHPDHIGGILDKDGQVIYKNAQLYLHPLELAHWRNDELFNAASEQGKFSFILARRALDAYAQNLHELDDNDIIAGIQAVWLPGHTPGHTGYRIYSDQESVLIWGDVVHFPHIQAAHPEVSIVYDNDPIQAEETRKKILTQVVQENWLVAGMHLGQSGFARIISADEGYRLLYL